MIHRAALVIANTPPRLESSSFQLRLKLSLTQLCSRKMRPVDNHHPVAAVEVEGMISDQASHLADIQKMMPLIADRPAPLQVVVAVVTTRAIP